MRGRPGGRRLRTLVYDATGPTGRQFYNARSREEVDAIFARLTERGADIVKALRAAFWGGYSGYLADPDGHRREVAFNPCWTLLPDGRISLKRE